MKMSELVNWIGRQPHNPVIEYKTDDAGKVNPDSLELTSGLHDLDNYVEIDVVECWTGFDVMDDGVEDQEISTDTAARLIQAIQAIHDEENR